MKGYSFYYILAIQRACTEQLKAVTKKGSSEGLNKDQRCYECITIEKDLM